MTISKRITNSKRHTIGFVLSGGRRVSRSQAVKMAQSSELKNVRVCRGPAGRYLQSTSNRSLYQLPEVISERV